MECRPLTTAVIEAALAWWEHRDLRPDRWRDETTRAAAGWEEDRLVAVGRIFTSRVHESRYWTEVVVAPELRRRGYGRRLVSHLATLRAEPKPLCTRGFVSSEPVAFARNLGARPYQRCPPQRAATRDADRLAISNIGTTTGSVIDPEELQRAWTDTYAWVHASWSPVAPGFEQPLLENFMTDLDLTHTRAVATSTVRAAAYVFLDDPEPVVVAECRTPTEADGLALLRACVRDSLQSLAAAGITTITFDGHDTDPHFRPLLNEIPTTGEAFELLEWQPVDHGTPAVP